MNLYNAVYNGNVVTHSKVKERRNHPEDSQKASCDQSFWKFEKTELGVWTQTGFPGGREAGSCNQAVLSQTGRCNWKPLNNLGQERDDVKGSQGSLDAGFQGWPEDICMCPAL